MGLEQKSEVSEKVEVTKKEKKSEKRESTKNSQSLGVKKVRFLAKKSRFAKKSGQN